MSAQQLKREIERSLEASFWLKKAVVELERRDPVDALGDAEVLLDFCRKRAQEVGVHGMAVVGPTFDIGVELGYKRREAAEDRQARGEYEPEDTPCIERRES